MTTVGRWATRWPNWLRLRQVFGESFPIFRDRWNCRLRSSAAIFSRAFQRRWPERLESVRSYLCLRTFIGPTNRRWRF